MRGSLSIFYAIVLAACKHDPQEMVTPVEECDTTEVAYSSAIVPILQTSCALPVCHVPGGNGTGDFTNYAGLHSQVVNGNLVPAVQRTSGAIPMPPDGSMLPECDILRIVAWVNAGAQENEHRVIRSTNGLVCAIRIDLNTALNPPLCDHCTPFADRWPSASHPSPLPLRTCSRTFFSAPS